MIGQSDSFESDIGDALRKKYDSVDSYQAFVDKLPAIYQFICDLLRDQKLSEQYRPYFTGALGFMLVSGTVLRDLDTDLLARVYLVSTVVRKLAQDSSSASLIGEYWPEGTEDARETFSEIIKIGNEELTKRQIRKIYRYAGFEARE